MANYGLKYQMSFENETNRVYEAFFEYKDYVDETFNIIGGVKAINIRSVNGDEDKFAPILGLECLFQIAVARNNNLGTITDDTQLTIYDLIAQHDNDIRVTVYADQDYTSHIFQGFVVVEDNSQPFLDPPFLLNVRALDGLGLLKQVDMVDANGDPFAGILSIENWLGNILAKTGQTMNLRTYFPFYATGTNENNPPLSIVYLDAQTWQTGELTTTTDPSVDVFASQSSDAYTALEAICRCLRARLFQQDGVWNFVSLYSYADPNGFYFWEMSFTLTAGIYHSSYTNSLQFQNYDINIGKDQILHPVADDGTLYLKLATKWEKLNYTYDQSANKICNQGFLQGDPDPTHDGTISSTFIDPSITPVVTFQTKAYNLFCWDHFDNVGSNVPYPNSPPSGYGYIEEVRDLLNYTLDRFVVLKPPTQPTSSYIRSSRILIDQGDIFQMSFTFRTKTAMGGGADLVGVAYVLLYGDDGSTWAFICDNDGLQDPVGTPNHWLNFPSGFTGHALPFILSAEIADTSKWNQVNVNQNPTIGTIDLMKVPVNGQIEVLIGLVGNADEFWFKNVQTSILPYLNGTYKAVKGDYNFSSSSNDIKQTNSQDVEISDAPKRYLKGALVDAHHSIIPPDWHRRSFVESEPFRFTRCMERIMYNNLYRIIQKFEGTIRGRTWLTKDYTVKESGYLNRYFFADGPTPTKMFILTSFDDDLGTGQGRRVFVECLNDNNDTGWVAPDSYKFDYIFQ